MESHDTLPLSTLEYASPSRSGKSNSVPGAKLLSLAAGLVGALLSFNALADAAGFPPLPGDMDRAEAGPVFLHILCGLVGGVLTFAFVRFAFIQGQAVVRGIQRSGVRPGQTTALALLCVGGSCILVAAITQLLAGRSSSGFVVEQLGNGGRAAIMAQPPLVTEVIVLLTFLLGAALVALGVWCSFMRAESYIRQSSITMPPVPRGDAGLPPVPPSQSSAA